MEPFFSELHPNPGWGDSFKSKDIDTIQFNSSENIGRHCILELYQCDHARLNDEAFIRSIERQLLEMRSEEELSLIHI